MNLYPLGGKGSTVTDRGRHISELNNFETVVVCAEDSYLRIHSFSPPRFRLPATSVNAPAHQPSPSIVYQFISK